MNKKILITAGPTHEAIDPVRFIGNHSSGKMGYAIAEGLANRGAEVILVSGPSALKIQHPRVEFLKLTSAAEMFQACKERIEEVDVAIFSAAVADFTPVEPMDKKVKRGKGDMEIRLKPTTDIAAELGKAKRDDQLFVGFALETNDGMKNAQGKLERKNLDLIVLNSLEDEGAGFGGDTNKVTLLDKSGNIDKFELKLKSEVANDIIDKILNMIAHA